MNLSAPVVKQKVLVPGTLNDYVTIGVISLDVHGKLMVLNLVFTPDFASVTASKPISLDDMLGKTGFGPWLLDTTNLKSYAALDDGGLKSSNDGVKTTNKVPVYVWATFALPEGDVEAIDLYIKTAWPAFTNIPITR
ncbi:MAG: hypothetical protein FWE61_06740 [Micrococcales bacterium]|nr:hypothetical protein [Micrococcales bacterium]